MSLHYYKLSVSSFVDVQQSVQHVNSVEGLLALAPLCHQIGKVYLLKLALSWFWISHCTSVDSLQDFSHAMALHLLVRTCALGLFTDSGLSAVIWYCIDKPLLIEPGICIACSGLLPCTFP